MTRKMMWLVSVVIGIAFAGLLFVQYRYMTGMVKMRQDQFSDAVTRSLHMSSRALERKETFTYLQRMANDNGMDSLPSLESIASGRVLPVSQSAIDSISMFQFTPIDMQKFANKMAANNLLKMSKRNHLNEAAQAFQDYVREAFLYQKNVLDEVIFTVLYTASKNRFEDRVDFEWLCEEIRNNLERNDIKLDFHISVSTADGREVFVKPMCDMECADYTFQQVLFPNDPADKMGLVSIHFPKYHTVLLDAAGLMIPAMMFTTLLFITFIVSVWLTFHRKQVAEMRNDFIHNMTHEFKTPISSISLAAQMLSDTSVGKSEALMMRLSNTIVNECSRLRMQVDKVLQMSLIDNHTLTLKFNELNVHDTIEKVVSIFSLKVQQSGGELSADLKATDFRIFADEMHFTNVIYNLLDNAVKYRRPDVPLNISIVTSNPGRNRICIEIKDNGRGIKRDALKHIFERFYRVSTGDQHDVKGFGLGLAYVKAIVEEHKGTIVCDSVVGQYTTFTIMMHTSAPYEKC